MVLPPGVHDGKVLSLEPVSLDRHSAGLESAASVLGRIAPYDDSLFGSSTSSNEEDARFRNAHLLVRAARINAGDCAVCRRSMIDRFLNSAEVALPFRSDGKMLRYPGLRTRPGRCTQHKSSSNT